MSISHLSGQYKRDLEKAHDMAAMIKDQFELLESAVDKLCARTCIDCQDICCNHATIWYDFKDLLYVYFSTGSFPKHQIEKVKSEKKGSFCCHFTPRGCRLPRTLRPFVCTWYFCPEQIQFLKTITPDLKIKIDKTLFQIKVLRNNIEMLFIDVTSGKNDGLVEIDTINL